MNERAPSCDGVAGFVHVHVVRVASQGSQPVDVCRFDLNHEIDILREARQTMNRTCHRTDRKISNAQFIQHPEQDGKRFIHPDSP